MKKEISKLLLQFKKKFLTRNVKAQITLFVILGMLFLFLAVFVMYSFQLANQARLSKQADEMIGDFTALRDVQEYTQRALKNAVDDAVEKLFLQGGYLTDELDSSLEGQMFLPYSFTELYPNGRTLTRNVSVYYGVVEQVPCNLYSSRIINLSDETTSYYPVKNVRLSNYANKYLKYISQGGCMPLRLGESSFSGFLGGYTFPALCSFDGENSKKNSAYCGAYQYDTPKTNNSIQRQIENYINKNLNKYINESYFSKRGKNISFDFENSNASAVYTNPTGLILNLKIHARVLVEGQFFDKEAKFSAHLDGSFKQMQSYIAELLTTMLVNPFFNLTQDWNNSSIILSYKPSIQLIIHKDVCLYQNNCQSNSAMDDSIFTFVDTMFKVKNKPLTMNVAIQNRRPILDYIHDTHYNNYIVEGQPLDKQYYTNETLFIDPLAIDPDGDKINYTYYGWKQDYYSYLNLTCCEELSNGCNITSYVDCLTDEEQINDFSETLMGSQSFISTNRSVDYKLNKSDTGFHNITLVVEDDYGKKDFQIIKILVFDVPRAVLNFSNNFFDVNNNFASIEDYFILNASESQLSTFLGGTFSKVLFVDEDEPFIISTIKLEYDLPNSSYDWSNITNGYFMRSNLDNDLTKLHNISLVVAQSFENSREMRSPPVYRALNVSQCLPHGYVNITGTNQLEKYNFSQNNLESFPFPFNSDFNNSPHICCSPFDETKTTNMSGGEFVTSNNVCFKNSFLTVYPFSQFGEMLYADKIIKEKDGVVTSAEDFDASQVESYKHCEPYQNCFNNIFNVTITQKCSGTRGNICSGEVNFHYDLVHECKNIDKYYQFARCQIPSSYPSRQLKNKDAGTVLSNPKCENLTGDSFENIFYKFLSENVQTDFLNKLSNNISNFNETLFKDGYCGVEGYFELSGTDLKKSNLGQFSCKPSCQNGDCVYSSLNDCSCKSHTVKNHYASISIGSSICDGISANSFFSDGKKQIVCKQRQNGYFACSSDCESHDDDKFACYCTLNKGNTVLEDFTNELNHLTKTQIDSFFIGNFKSVSVNGGSSNSKCCTSDAIIYDAGATSNPVCFKGKYYEKNKIFGKKNQFLSYRGLAFCQEANEYNDYYGATVYEEEDLISGPEGTFRCTESGWKTS